MVSNDLALWTVYPKSAPQDAATEKLVHTLRNDILPKTGQDVKVGGITATLRRTWQARSGQRR